MKSSWPLCHLLRAPLPPHWPSSLLHSASSPRNNLWCRRSRCTQQRCIQTSSSSHSKLAWLPSWPLPLSTRTFSHARTVGSGIAVKGTCRHTLCTTAQAVRSSRPQPHPRQKTNPRSPTPMNASAPSHSATRAAPVPAHWRSTCAHTVVNVHLSVSSVCQPSPRKQTVSATLKSTQTH